MFDVVGVGDLDIDIYIELDRIPDFDEKLLANDHHFHGGGMVANTIVALTRLGKSCLLHAPVGDDLYGKLAIADLEHNGVETSGLIKKADGRTYFCVVMLDHTGEKSLIVVPTDSMNPKSKELSAETIQSARHMHTTLFPDVSGAIELAHAKEMSISIDIEPSMLHAKNQNEISKLLELVDIVFLGEQAAKQIGGTDDPQFNLKRVQTFGPKTVCLTQGNQGGLISDRSSRELIQYQAYKVNVIDSTGAGDCFAAGFIYGYLEGWGLSQIAQFASAVAAINTQHFGGHDGAPTLEDVENFIRNF